MSELSIIELPGQLINALQHPADNCFFIDGDCIEDKATFLNEFAIKLKFPDYFGFNWDAFADCMTDLAWLNTDSGFFLIIYKNPYKFRSNNPCEWEIANSILLDAMSYWKKIA